MLQYILLISIITAIKKNLKILTVTNKKGLLMFVINIFFFFFFKLILFNVFRWKLHATNFFLWMKKFIVITVQYLSYTVVLHTVLFGNLQLVVNFTQLDLKKWCYKKLFDYSLTSEFFKSFKLHRPSRNLLFSYSYQ